jgi:hypothetical protein
MLHQSLVYLRRLKTFFNLFCTCPRGYSVRTKLVGNTPLKWSAEIPQDSLLLEIIENETCETHILKYRVWYPGETYVRGTDAEYKDLITKDINMPWVWIGGDNINASEMMSYYLVRGNHIKLELLQKLNPSIKNWTYVDYETLELNNFPVEGILIR